MCRSNYYHGVVWKAFYVLFLLLCSLWYRDKQFSMVLSFFKIKNKISGLEAFVHSFSKAFFKIHNNLMHLCLHFTPRLNSLGRFVWMRSDSKGLFKSCHKSWQKIRFHQWSNQYECNVKFSSLQRLQNQHVGCFRKRRDVFKRLLLPFSWLVPNFSPIILRYRITHYTTPPFMKAPLNETDFSLSLCLYSESTLMIRRQLAREI